MSTIDQILKTIKKARSIVILTHENPDGDAIGSSLAMFQALQSLDKDVDLIIPEYSKVFESLPGLAESKRIGAEEKYDLAIALDCATEKLLNGWTNYFDSAKTRIVIDHHSTNSMYGDLNYVDPSAPACSQIIYKMFRHYRWKINNDIGSCILAGIITDTGGFQYSGVSKETLDIAAQLVGQGINITKIYKQVFTMKSRASFELKKLAIGRMEFLEDDKIAFTYITKKDEEKVDAGVGDYEGIVNEGVSIKGVEVSIFLHERDGKFKISLRANDYVNVSNVAVMFGGGGHEKAAGAMAEGSPEEIRDALVEEIKRQLK